MYLNIMKTIYCKPKANIVFNVTDSMNYFSNKMVTFYLHSHMPMSLSRN